MSMKGVNLIPVARQQAAAARRRARCWAWIVAGYGMILFAGLGVCLAALNSGADDITLELEKSSRQIEELTKSASSLRPQLAEAHTKLIVARTVGDQPDWSHLLGVISATVDDEIVLSSTKLEPAPADLRPTSRPIPNKPAAKNVPTLEAPGDMIVTLQGLARTQGSVSQLLLRLEKLGLFERVVLRNSSRQAVGSGGEAQGFRIECLLRRRNSGEAGQ